MGMWICFINSFTFSWWWLWWWRAAFVYMVICYFNLPCLSL